LPRGRSVHTSTKRKKLPVEKITIWERVGPRRSAAVCAWAMRKRRTKHRLATALLRTQHKHRHICTLTTRPWLGKRQAAPSGAAPAFAA
jgi:hypothetical protein